MNGAAREPHRGATHPSPCVAFQHSEGLPGHNTTHCWRPECNDRHTLPLLRKQTKMAFQIRGGVTHLFQFNLLPPNNELVDYLPAHLRDSYARDFCLADDAFHSGRVETASRGRKKYWDHWQKYVEPVGVDSYLQDTIFSKQMQLLSAFTAQVRTGYYGKGNQVKHCTVSIALMAIGQMIALACDSNPKKVMGSERLLPRLQVMLDGYQQVDLPIHKKLPVQANVPELLLKTAYQADRLAQQRAMADLTMIAFYYLLRVGEYM